jgi:hypothetical protein
MDEIFRLGRPFPIEKGPLQFDPGGRTGGYDCAAASAPVSCRRPGGRVQNSAEEQRNGHRHLLTSPAPSGMTCGGALGDSNP